MSETITSPQPEASTSAGTSHDAVPARTTGRTRVKSQRVLEAEETKRYLHKQAQAQSQAEEVVSALEKPASKSKSQAKGKKSKGKKVAEGQVYCICKTDNDGPMIECGECNDWYHFNCMGLTDDEAEKIHVYVCPECTETTNKKTTYKYDISTFPSPSPPPGVIPTKRKSSKQKQEQKQKQPKATRTPSQTSDVVSSSGSESEAEIVHSSSSRHSSVQPTPPPQSKKPRTSISADIKRKPSVAIDRKPSIDSKPSSGSGISGLPPVRKYVREKFIPLFTKVFGNTTPHEKIERFSAEVEDGIYSNFKDVVNGKEIAGTRYKTQFNLLSSSIARGLRPDLIASITSHTLIPLQIATLTSADLASEEQRAAIQRAKQSVLEQTVKSKSDSEPSSSIRLGRDGFEKVENAHEKEMILLAQQEELARLKAEEDKKRELEKINNPSSDVSVSVSEKSPMTKDQPKFKVEHKRSESIDTNTILPSPLRQTSLIVNSAWNKDRDREENDDDNANREETFNVDQSNLDLSDIIGDTDMEIDDELNDKPEEVKKSEIEVFESKEILWSGGIVNPANLSKIIPPMSLRLTCRPSSSSSTSIDWNVLLPHKTIEITGRVPTANSLQYLSDMRLNPTKELITIAFSLDGSAKDEEILTWEEMVDYHISRDRHAIYLPYGSHPPQGAAKELYLIPLRPQDDSPEFTELIDGYSLPKKGRSTSVFLGIFIFNKSSTPTPAPAARPPQPQPQPQSTPSSASGLGVPVIQNDQLQALMASLNPTALQSLVGGITPTPIPTGGSTPPIVAGGTMPTQYPVSQYPYQNQYPQQQQQQGYLPYPPSSGGYTPQPPSGPTRDWRDREREREREGGSGRDPRKRDNGWGNRDRDRDRRY
ncbi:hypothetical protein I203_104984 [Kwoniella mangroviensis CBS 8507]|uniref:uncharacterized protein n=1 Tax=Kwoniella mangroviensis CBS 8507 TaxID=1296122 RepID=UPI00080CF3C3|nr:uncharacterized protein I203_00072 [Kwoniella mangroviensis CBS 8507]OCF69945.1 hypothetical protein I203_00072 [Kwoniella mangroviensis CBS 8507]